jgi:hypothetical protein
MGDGNVGRRSRQPDRHQEADDVPAFHRPSVQRVHRVPRLRGQRGRIQSDGHGALRAAALCRKSVEADPAGSRTGRSRWTWIISASSTPPRAPSTTSSCSCSASRARLRCCSSPKIQASQRTSAMRRRTFNELCKLNQHYADIAASIQQVTEEVLICMARQLHKEDRPDQALHRRRRRD